MHFLAHRGFWKLKQEQNTKLSFAVAMESNFGIETDFRDYCGSLVVSHDLPTDKSFAAEDFFALHAKIYPKAVLALNIKADGLRQLLKPLLEKYSVTNYFCFDMSVPEMLVYRREGLRYFTRESEYESNSTLYQESAGVWMDMFHTDWINPVDIRRHLDAGKQVAIVSPELHRRPQEVFWQSLREAELFKNDALMLCTDYPDQARRFFYA